MKEFLIWVVTLPNPVWWLMWSVIIIVFAAVGMATFESQRRVFRVFYIVRAIGLCVGWWASFMILADIFLGIFYC